MAKGAASTLRVRCSKRRRGNGRDSEILEGVRLARI